MLFMYTIHWGYLSRFVELLFYRTIDIWIIPFWVTLFARLFFAECVLRCNCVKCAIMGKLKWFAFRNIKIKDLLPQPFFWQGWERIRLTKCFLAQLLTLWSPNAVVPNIITKITGGHALVLLKNCVCCNHSPPVHFKGALLQLAVDKGRSCKIRSAVWWVVTVWKLIVIAKSGTSAGTKHALSPFCEYHSTRSLVGRPRASWLCAASESTSITLTPANNITLVDNIEQVNTITLANTTLIANTLTLAHWVTP